MVRLNKLYKNNLWVLSSRQICDLEMILNGGFAPLEGFLNKEDYESVLKNMRLKNGMLWPIPVTLDVSEKFADSIKTTQYSQYT